MGLLSTENKPEEVACEQVEILGTTTRQIMGHFCLTIPTRIAIIPLKGSENVRFLNLFIYAFFHSNSFSQPATIVDVILQKRTLRKRKAFPTSH